MPEENPNPTRPAAGTASTPGVNTANTPNASTAEPSTTTSTPTAEPTDTPTASAPTSSTPSDTTSNSANPATPESVAPSAPQPTPNNPQDTTPAPMASPIMKSALNKPKNKLLPIVIILAILTLTGLGTSIFGFTQISNKDSEIVRLKNQIASQVTPPSDETPDNPDDNPENPENPDEISPEIRSKVLASIPSGLAFADAKELNAKNPDARDTVHFIRGGVNGWTTQSPVYLDWNLEDSVGTLTLNWDIAKEVYGLTTDKTSTESLTDFGPNNTEVVDVLACGFGQAAGKETILFLMKDGTVEYIPLRKAFANNNFKSYGKLSGVENVIKLLPVSVNNRHGAGGYVSTVAQRADGNYYDLSSITRATGNYEP